MKKIFLLLIILTLFPSCVFALELAPNAKSSILIETSTGKVLYENNSSERRAPASMTKVMTLLLIMEKLENGSIKFTDQVPISENASKMGGSQVFLEAGSEMSVEQLVKAISIASGNDAAVAMAEFIGGSVEKFVEMMNNKARELGMNNTNYENVHGLDSENHYTSAADMAIVARELVKYKKILEFSSTYEEYLKKPDGSSTWMVNTNKLIRYYSGLDGLKTGFTETAGYCLTATASKNNMRLISVVMGEESSEVRNKETVELLNYGFSNYKTKNILKKTSKFDKIKIYNGKKDTINISLKDDVTDLIGKDDNNNYKYEIKIDKIEAPIKKGQKVGILILKSNEKKISEFDIVSLESVKKANYIDYYKKNLKNFITGLN